MLASPSKNLEKSTAVKSDRLLRETTQALLTARVSLLGFPGRFIFHIDDEEGSVSF
jgi:hypothetical protein